MVDNGLSNEAYLHRAPDLIAPFVPSWVFEVLRITGTHWYLTSKVLAWCAKDPTARVGMFLAVEDLSRRARREAHKTGVEMDPFMENKRIEALIQTDPKPRLKKPLWSKKTLNRPARKALARKDAAQ